jgi:hypothetical protein
MTSIVFLPKAKSSHECMGIISRPATRRQLFQFLYVTSSEDYIVRSQGGNQTLHDVGDNAPPLFPAIFLYSPDPDVVLKCGFFVRQVA